MILVSKVLWGLEVRIPGDNGFTHRHGEAHRLEFFLFRPLTDNSLKNVFDSRCHHRMNFDANLFKKLHRGGFHRRFILFAVEAFTQDSWTCPITQKKIFWRLLHLRVVGSVKPAQVGGRR